MLVPANTIMSSALLKIPLVFGIMCILYMLHSLVKNGSPSFDVDLSDAHASLRSERKPRDPPRKPQHGLPRVESLRLDDHAPLGPGVQMTESLFAVPYKINTPVVSVKKTRPKYNKLEAANKKVILFWTRFFRKDNIHLHDDLGNCTVNTCFLTTDRSHLNKSAAIVFHQRDMHLHVYDLPPHRQPHQVYVFFMLESAHFSTGWGEGVDLSLPQWKHFFNLTFTYRIDSDVYCPAYTHLIYRPQLWFDRTKAREILKGKKNRALIFNSHCKAPSRREDYVIELNRTFPVDVVGKCGQNLCQPDFMVDIVGGCRHPPCRANPSDCEQRLTESYKFYLAFENSYCRDYMSEKVIRPLNYGSVPIIYGGGDPSAMLPDKSFINTAGFQSPKSLGHYLWTLVNSTELYESHHEWRYSASPGLKLFNDFDDISMCKLCKVLHNDTFVEWLQKRHLNIFDWWITGSNCATPPLNVSSNR